MDEHALRQILESQAARVEVRPDALPEIRRRIAARRARWWLPTRLSGGIMLTLGTGAATAVVVLAVGLGSCAPRPDVPPIGGPSSPPAVSSPAPSPAPSVALSERPAGPAPGGPVPLRVYYLRNDRGYPRLYPEFHPLAAGDGSPAARTRAALTEMFDGLTAYDPDYSSGWPAGTRVREVRIEGSAVVVDLTGFHNGTDPGQLDPVTVRQAVQQLVYTATTPQASNKEVVRLRLDGQPVAKLWGVADVAGDLRRGSKADVLGLIWLIDPQEGATVGRSFTVNVAGIVPEATMHVRVRQGSTVVTDRLVTLDAGGPDQGTASVPVTLAPGTYTIEGYATSLDDGSEQHLENHVITVR